jgi:ferredoxin
MVVVPMVWCRYLCPLGGALWPIAWVGALRLRRDPAACTGCRACDRACPHSLEVSGTDEVRSGECTLCLACQDACPTRGALLLEAPVLPRAVPRAAVPALVVLLAVAGVAAGDVVALPSHTLEVAPAGPSTAVTSLVVRQVRCSDTARLAAEHLATAPGVLTIVSYAARHTMEVTYDPARTDPARLRAALEGPVWDAESGQFLYGRYQVIEIDGETP